jgi:hypothetical protein
MSLGTEVSSGEWLSGWGQWRVDDGYLGGDGREQSSQRGWSETEWVVLTSWRCL